MANKRFGEDFVEFTTSPKDDDMLLMLSSADNKTYKTRRSELFRNVNVEYTVFQFAKNASKTVAPKIGWTEAPPITEDNEWLWIRQGKIAPLTSSLPVWSAPVRIKGEQGSSEVYVGKTPPTDGTFQIAIDPDGDLNGGIPSGGKTGEALTKTSNNDFATTWGSPLRALFIARGAVWNASTGFYELNGLTDITEGQMIDIYNQTNILNPSHNVFVGNYSSLNRTNFRTNFQMCLVGSNDYPAIGYNENVEIYSPGLPSYTSYLRGSYIVYIAAKLKKITNVIICDTTTSTYYTPFYSVPLLETIYLNKIKYSVDIASGASLTRDSIIYMITNAANTKPITITLHPNAKARLTTEDIALASSKNITIV